MDYYRRYVGDYLAKTQDLSMIEDGAYGRLLDYYYAKEEAPPAARVYEIARASKPADRAAVKAVLEQHFVLGEDGRYHNARADKELGIAVPKIEKLREVARENGKKGGRPKKPNPVPSKNQYGFPQETNPGYDSKPNPVPTEKQPAGVKQPPSANRQPESKPPSEQRSHGREGKPDSAGALGAAGLRDLQPPGPEASVSAASETPAGMLAAVCQRNGIQANAFHPLIVDWTRDGVDVDKLKAAIAKAREPQRKGDGHIPLAYLDKILEDLNDSKPRPKPWKTSDEAAEALCRELGIKGSKVGEQRDEWHRRIEHALADQARRKVA